MSLIEKSLGRRHDWPQIETGVFGALIAGNATDPATDTVIVNLPDLRRGSLPNTGEGYDSALPINRMVLRQALIMSQGAAATVGNATNYADLRLNLWRFSGATGLAALQGCLSYLSLSVNTASATTIAVGQNVVITPTAMTAIVPGIVLLFSGGTGNAELVTVKSVTATTFTADFTQTHSGGYALTSVLLPYIGIPMTPAYGVNTTSATTITAGVARVVTPASIYGIHVGDNLYFSGGTGTAEYVQVTAVTNTTFTATFVNGHSGGYTIVSGTNNAVMGSNYIATNQPFEILPGDTLTLNRVSNNVTGLATPALVAEIEWVPSQIKG